MQRRDWLDYADKLLEATALCTNELLDSFQRHGLRALNGQAERSAPNKRDGRHGSGHAEDDGVANVSVSLMLLR